MEKEKMKIHTPGKPYSKRPKPTMVVTGAITTGLMNLQHNNKSKSKIRLE